MSANDFDYFEFVHCGCCMVEYLPPGEAVPAQPFWLTDCGHVICNQHLSADKTCSQCKSTPVLYAPLARDLDPPMSDWFRSIPHGLDALAAGAKFQQQNMASMIRWYKLRCAKQKSIIDRFTVEFKELKMLVARQKHEIERLGGGSEQSDRSAGQDLFHATHSNSYQHYNGKKRRMDADGAGDNQPASNPRSSFNIPVRLTIPANQRIPTPLSLPPPSEASNEGIGWRHEDHRATPAVSSGPRPTSARFQGYAYNSSSVMDAAGSGHQTYQTPAPLAPANRFQGSNGESRNSFQQPNRMPPPPTPQTGSFSSSIGNRQNRSSFKPAPAVDYAADQAAFRNVQQVSQGQPKWAGNVNQQRFVPPLGSVIPHTGQARGSSTVPMTPSRINVSGHRAQFRPGSRFQ